MAQFLNRLQFLLAATVPRPGGAKPFEKGAFFVAALCDCQRSLSLKAPAARHAYSPKPPWHIFSSSSGAACNPCGIWPHYHSPFGAEAPHAKILKGFLFRDGLIV
jgi:hypothetical protein